MHFREHLDVNVLRSYVLPDQVAQSQSAIGGVDFTRNNRSNVGNGWHTLAVVFADNLLFMMWNTIGECGRTVGGKGKGKGER